MKQQWKQKILSLKHFKPSYFTWWTVEYTSWWKQTFYTLAGGKWGKEFLPLSSEVEKRYINAVHLPFTMLHINWKLILLGLAVLLHPENMGISRLGLKEKDTMLLGIKCTSGFKTSFQRLVGEITDALSAVYDVGQSHNKTCLWRLDLFRPIFKRYI